MKGTETEVACDRHDWKCMFSVAGSNDGEIGALFPDVGNFQRNVIGYELHTCQRCNRWAVTDYFNRSEFLPLPESDATALLARLMSRTEVPA